MTMLEIMIVLAVIGGLFFIVRSGFRLVTRADLVEDSTELTAVLRRASDRRPSRAPCRAGGFRRLAGRRCG